ncbi:hypothetical protein LTR42_000339 [Elasticomyces elasticus]|nr:hypothetical protein LTR42_000339 [Elasticomyces elasticus]
MADITDWKATAKPDPEWEETATKGQAPDIGLFPDIPALRQWITQSKEAMSAEMGGSISGVNESDHQVAMRDGQKITCRVYKPESPSSGGSPLAVIYHGGGWCIGGLENEELLCRLLTSKLGVICVNVDYRLAPEHKWPLAIHDSYDATKWAAKNAGADPSKGFLIGGTSAGGNMTAVVAHMWRDAGDKPGITGCHLMIPAVCWQVLYRVYASCHLANFAVVRKLLYSSTQRRVATLPGYQTQILYFLQPLALIYPPDPQFMPKAYKKDCTSMEQNKDAPILGQKAMVLVS